MERNTVESSPDVRMTSLLIIEEMGKAQITEKESTCGANINLKGPRDRAIDESTLSLDVTEVIAKRIKNVFDYLNFRATNRLFRLAAPPVQWRSPSSAISLSRFDFDDLSLSRTLFVSINKDKVLTIVHPKYGLKYKYTIKMPIINQILNGKICYSKDGLLLLEGKRKESFFFNPFTKQVLQLLAPRRVDIPHPAPSSECVIIKFVQSKLYPNPNNSIMACYCGKIFFFEDLDFPIDNVSPIFHNGAFYYLGRKGKLRVIEVTEGEASCKELEEVPCAPCTIYFKRFLVECDGNLLSVFEGPFEKNMVQVFKLNESTMSWVKVKSLENHMLLVGPTSFSAVANNPGMENKIYFPRFYGQSIVFYSLETNNYHTFENEVVNVHHVEDHLNSSWIEPRWH